MISGIKRNQERIIFKIMKLSIYYVNNVTESNHIPVYISRVILRRLLREK